MTKIVKSKTGKKNVSLLDAAIIGSTTPTMGELEIANAKPKKAAKTAKTKKVTLLDAAIIGATTPSMGKSEKGKSAAENKVKRRK